MNAAGQVVPGGGQPTFFSASTTGTFTVNALPTPSFQAITVTVDRTTGTPNETNTLTSNVAKRNGGVGIELSVGVTGITVTLNKAKKNHLDFCDESSATSIVSMNNFGTKDLDGGCEQIGD